MAGKNKENLSPLHLDGDNLNNSDIHFHDSPTSNNSGKREDIATNVSFVSTHPFFISFCMSKKP